MLSKHDATKCHQRDDLFVNLFLLLSNAENSRFNCELLIWHKLIWCGRQSARQVCVVTARGVHTGRRASCVGRYASYIVRCASCLIGRASCVVASCVMVVRQHASCIVHCAWCVIRHVVMRRAFCATVLHTTPHVVAWLGAQLMRSCLRLDRGQQVSGHAPRAASLHTSLWVLHSKRLRTRA